MGAGGSRTCPGPAVGAQTLTLDARVKGKTAAAVRPATRWRFPPSGVPRVSAVPLVCPSRQEHWGAEPSQLPDTKAPLTPWRATCLHPAMPSPEPLTRRRTVDLVRVAAALCRTTG